MDPLILTHLVLQLLLPLSAADGDATADLVDLMIADMTQPHEVRPEGVPDAYGWNTNPRVGAGNKIPDGWTCVTMWGQVYIGEGGSPASNVRVEVREPVLLYLSKADGAWHVLQRCTSVEGAAYREDFANDEAIIADARTGDDDSVSVRLTAGRNYHFWPGDDGPRRAVISPADIEAVASAFRARLVVDDPELPDDRAQARIVAGAGGDYWRSLDAGWAPDWSNNGDWALGRFRLLTPEWQTFTATTADTDTLRANPPVLYPD